MYTSVPCHSTICSLTKFRANQTKNHQYSHREPTGVNQFPQTNCVVSFFLPRKKDLRHDQGGSTGGVREGVHPRMSFNSKEGLGSLHGAHSLTQSQSVSQSHGDSTEGQLHYHHFQGNTLRSSLSIRVCKNKAAPGGIQATFKREICSVE